MEPVWGRPSPWKQFRTPGDVKFMVWKGCAMCARGFAYPFDTIVRAEFFNQQFYHCSPKCMYSFYHTPAGGEKWEGEARVNLERAQDQGGNAIVMLWQVEAEEIWAIAGDQVMLPEDWAYIAGVLTYLREP